ncbi:MAG TPA: biopolymer transporter Tol [Verrucomicrobiae bacterium]|nr:biopolymer transporter Tol [Verrucomicrobiae bacterium]
MERLWTMLIRTMVCLPLLSGLAAGVDAQVDVVKGRHSFGVSGFSGDAAIAGQVTDVLKNDLRLSGYFALAPVGSAEYVQSGTVRGDRNGIVVECIVMQQATKRVALSKAYQGSAQDVRRVVHKLSDEIVQAIAGQRGIAETKVAFVWAHNGAKELAVMDYDGYNVRQLTYDRSISVRPRWSPDGRKVVYTSYKNVFPDVLEVDLYTGQRRRLASYPGLNSGAAFSPDGLSIALTLSKDGNPELYTMNAEGTDLRRLTHTHAGESSPTWSPDGQTIAYVSDESGVPQIWQINRDGGSPLRLTVSPSYNTEPDWSRPPANSDMKPMLAVTSRVAGKFQIGVYEKGSGVVTPVVADGTDNEDPSWAPDGRHLIFTKTVHWHSQLYLLDVVTGEQVQLPSLEGGASEPAWGP